MEGTLKSDVYQNRSDARRFLVYRDDVTGKPASGRSSTSGFHSGTGAEKHLEN